MEEVIPLFKSHYSLGRSILTLDMPKEFTDDRSDTVFDIVDDITPELKDVFLVEDSMAGFLEAYTNAKELKKKLIFGLRLTFCPDSLEKSEEGRKNSYKNIIFIKNEGGYKQLIKIYTYAAQDGFYYEPRLDFKKLKEFWTDDLILGIPFYDSFLYNNKYTDSQCIPDFSFNNPVFLIEDNDTLLDKDMGKAVEKFCEGKYETVKAQSVYYRRNEDFGAYMTARCINKRTTTEKPNLEGMCSDQFSIEAWCKKTGSKITGKPRRAIEEKAEAPEEEIRSDQINARRLSSGMIEFSIPNYIITEAKARGEKLGKLNGSILEGKGNTTGYVGQIMFQKIFGGGDTDEECNTKKFRFDVSFKGEGWEMKTKHTTMNFVDSTYDASISCNTPQQKFDKVVFFRVKLWEDKDKKIPAKNPKGWFGGYASYDQWMENRFFAKKGDVDPSNGHKEYCDCWKMKYGSMLALPNPQLEIITNG